MKVQSFSQTIHAVPFGGSGSGDFGHAGRPGHIGGSSPGPGGHSRMTEKQRKAYNKKQEAHNAATHKKWLESLPPEKRKYWEQKDREAKERGRIAKEYEKKHGPEATRIHYESEKNDNSLIRLANTNPRIPAGDNFAPGIGWY